MWHLVVGGVAAAAVDGGVAQIVQRKNPMMRYCSCSGCSWLLCEVEQEEGVDV